MYIVLANPSDATLSLHLTHFGQVVSKETWRRDVREERKDQVQHRHAGEEGNKDLRMWVGKLISHVAGHCVDVEKK